MIDINLNRWGKIAFDNPDTYPKIGAIVILYRNKKPVGVCYLYEATNLQGDPELTWVMSGRGMWEIERDDIWLLVPDIPDSLFKHRKK